MSKEKCFLNQEKDFEWDNLKNEKERVHREKTKGDKREDKDSVIERRQRQRDRERERERER